MVKKGKKKGNNSAGACTKNQCFEIGDLVAGQMKGYPFWPGRIIDTSSTGRNTRYKVEFFPDRDVAVLPLESIKPFKDFNPRPQDLKRKNFVQAYKECQEEFASLLIAKDAKRESSPAPSLETIPSEAQSVQSGPQSAHIEPSTIPETSAPFESPKSTEPSAVPSEDGSTSPVEPKTSNKNYPISDIGKDTIKVEVEQDEPKTSTIRIKSEKKSPQKAKRKSARKSPTKLDTRTNDNNKVLPKVEREDPNSRDFTINKLQRKIDAKLKEKARMKQEETEKRILKSTEALVRINKKLAKFLRYSQQLLTLTREARSFSDWESAVKEFTTIEGVLVKCITFLQKKNRRSDDLKSCRDILTELAGIFKKIKGDPKLPQSTNDKIKSCLKLMRKNTHIKDLINMPDVEFEKQENSMIERKENSVDQ